MKKLNITISDKALRELKIFKEENSIFIHDDAVNLILLNVNKKSNDNK